MSNRRQRFVFGVLATLVGAAMFVVASSYIVSRGLPHWLAGTVGALAFPVLPLSWQLLGERKRKKKLAAAKTPSKSTLTGGDRYWLRLLVVALVVLGPMIALGKFDVARAVFRHGLWFVPKHFEPTTTHGGPLSQIGAGTPRTVDVFGTPLARVPSDAELVVFVQSPPGDAEPGRAALAYGDRQLMLAAEGKGVTRDSSAEEKVAELNKARGKMPWLPTDEISLVSHSDTELIAASTGWRSLVALPGMGPREELMHELGRAPKDALLSAAFIPKTTHDVLSTKAGAAWVYKSGDKLVVEGRVEANDEPAAKRLVAEATRALDQAAHDAPATCHEQVATLVKAVKLDQTGAIVTGRLEVDASAILGVALCKFKDR